MNEVWIHVVISKVPNRNQVLLFVLSSHCQLRIRNYYECFNKLNKNSIFSLLLFKNRQQGFFRKFLITLKYSKAKILIY